MNSNLNFQLEDFLLVDGGRAAQMLGPRRDLKLLVVNPILGCGSEFLI